MAELHYTTVTDEKTGRSVRLSTWTEDEQWWVKITINGVDRKTECLGPVDEATTQADN